MLDLPKEFEALGFTEEMDEFEVITYVMDFPGGQYVIVSDDNGKTPVRAKQNLVLACYDGEGRYIWGSECKTFMELEKICAEHKAGSPELQAALKNASKTLKDSDWASPSHP